jgi:uncharacterized membrane protein
VVENSDSSVAYSGSWRQYSDSQGSGGSYHRSHYSGNQASFTFSGTKVRWIGMTDRYAGIADIYIDGQFVTEVDAYASSMSYQEVLFESATLSSGSHTITVQVTGKKNPSAGSTRTFVDAFQVL